MGFSLKSALAGAIAGGAHAVGEVATSRINEMTRQRERAEAFDYQKEHDRLRDDALANREQRVMDMKEAREKKTLGERSKFMTDGLATLRGEKIDPASVKGQNRMAQIAGEAGYTDLYDKYTDNATRLLQISDANERAREAKEMHYASIAESRAGRADSKKEAEFANAYNRAVQEGQRGVVRDPVNPEKSTQFKEGGSLTASVFQEAIDNKYSIKKALAIANQLGRLISSKVSADTKNPFAEASLTTEGFRIEKGFAKPKPVTQTAPVTAAPATVAPVIRTPGAFENTAIDADLKDIKW